MMVWNTLICIPGMGFDSGFIVQQNKKTCYSSLLKSIITKWNVKAKVRVIHTATNEADTI
jgi:hypothetical protein